jgi:hypothetical protein
MVPVYQGVDSQRRRRVPDHAVGAVDVAPGRPPGAESRTHRRFILDGHAGQRERCCNGAGDILLRELVSAGQDPGELDEHQPGDPTIASVVCSDESQGCACKTILNPSGGVETGRYTTSGNSLTTRPDQAGSDSESNRFAVPRGRPPGRPGRPARSTR